ncbi:MAG: hypothetical protein JWL69_3116 [Phycisphaerales bacterium]|nr:hypothetical protein [Phycisphaerales bacterium]
MAFYNPFDVEHYVGANGSNMSKFIRASEVTSPRRRWSLIQVLDDSKDPLTCVLALGRWENQPKLALRWNGDAKNPIGNPQSRGLATWFILPARYNDAMIETLTPEMKTLARNFLPEKR